MKTLHKLLQPLAWITLVGIIGYQFFFQHSALHEARQLTHQMHQQLDTLRIITAQYEITHTYYLQVQKRLLQSHHRVTSIHQELNSLANDQQASLASIQVGLRNILRSNDPEVYQLPSHFIDSLVFQP